MIKKISMVLIIINITLLGCQTQTLSNKEKKVAVEITEVKRKNISNNVTLNTHLEPKENAFIIIKTPGINVTNIKVNAGDFVKKGDFLFELDKSIVRKQIGETKQAYDLARKNYEEQKIQYEQSDKEEPTDALETMYKNKIIGGLQLPYLPQQNKDSTLAIAKSQVEQARVAYSSALSQLNELEYYSPIDGYISQKNINKNQPVLDVQPALVISNIEKLKASVFVSKPLFKQLEEGQIVGVNIDSTEVEGKITNLNSIPNLNNNLHLVEIEVNNKEGNPWVGSFSSISVELNRKENIIVIPKGAILEDKKGNYVFVEENNRVYRKKISLGIDNGEEVEVVSGLRVGEQIVTKGHQFVKDRGLVITVRGEENENL